jgi:C4-dicarboxylate-specific signal transduction histidine kinase
MTASLVHELRQPLFMIKARTQLARAGEGASAEALADIEQGVEYIEDLLAHYGGAAEVDTQLTTLDCNIAVNTAIQMLDYRARQIGADLQVSLDTVPLTAELRAGAVRQVLVNLVQNALDAVEGHERRVVRVQTRGEAEHISLVVVDSGSGVDPEIRGRMFRPFVTSKPPGKGTGLGLFIARELVEHAGGQLIIEPTEEGGTRVEVRLPRVRS